MRISDWSSDVCSSDLDRLKQDTMVVPAHQEPVNMGTSIWVLILMTLTYTSSFMDRTVLSIIQNPIKAELGLSDTQLGILGGFAFALFYSTLGIDRKSVV